jgi:ribonucleoside-diphosphate reductase alpha chain
LKGITVYREGSREGVLISDNAKNNNVEIKITQAPKRPTSLDGKVHLIKPNGKQFTVFVGLLKGRPYEVFVLDHAQAGVSDGMTGHIIKDADDDASSGTTYYFESGALWVRRLNKFEDNEISLVTRLMSTALRHGTPLERIIEQVGKSKVPISNFARAIVRALGTYIKQEELIGKFKCRDCGSTEIKFEGSCYTCMSCGSSKCS